MSVADKALAGRSVLVVDDHDPHRRLLLDYLGAVGCECTGASGGHEALAYLSERTFDLVLLDLRMDDLDGMEVLERAKSEGASVPFIMMSAEGTISHAVEAIRLGAKDFLVKPFELEQLHEAAARVAGTFADSDLARSDPRARWRDQHAADMIGLHPSLLEIFLVLERIAGTDCTVLVLGESGTGKELVARALHHASPRTKKPFVPVNCGAIPETLIESELFGHARGAFSGATQAREGRFAAADGGTLFLDEIGEMSLAVQVKFLRVLQEQEYVPVGETRPRKCDVRIIAATNKDLEAMAEQGDFREDLFYRLNLIPIRLPPLRERLSDVPALAEHFLQKLASRRQLSISGFTDAALEVMQRYLWPGNVRELQNTVERMTLLHQGHGLLDVDGLPAKVQQEAASMPPLAAEPEPVARAVPSAPAVVSTPTVAEPASVESMTPPKPRRADRPEDFVLPEDGLDLREAVEAFEMSLIDQALERTGGNKNQAAILLQMNRTTLVEKLRKRKQRT